jgi:signal transduction histidine kinase
MSDATSTTDAPTAPVPPAPPDAPAPAPVRSVRSPRGSALAERLPSWMGSIRFRLTALYSLFLFGLAAVVVAGLYIGLSRNLDSEPISRTVVVYAPVRTEQGIMIREDTIRAQYQTVEQLANRRALRDLRTYSSEALAFLFLASLGVGWIVAGRVLGPIGRITSVARDIQATDLSRRISLGGPPDELRDLADTFDAMLGRLDDAFEGQRRFIQEASHELRNPLAVMRTNIDVALADPDASTEELRHTAEVVGRTAERLGRLVEDLLAYARHDVPRRAQERVALAPLVDEAVEEFAAPAEARGVELRGEHGDPVEVLADRTALKQALANLLDNAVRLAPEGSAINVSDAATDGWARLLVADAGPGIDAADQEAVFQRFWRGSGQPGGDERRSGLGLTIVRQIAESHGGHVALASEPGIGSTFVIWLPALPEVSP